MGENKEVVEVGESYDHANHGQVTVTGIYREARSVDRARNLDEKDTIVVRYSSDGGSFGNLSDTLDEFLAAID